MENLRRSLLPIFLCCAAKSGDVIALDELLSQGADVNNPSDYDGKSCLHIASAEGNVEMVRHLLDNGAFVHVKDKRGRVPLFDAIRYLFMNFINHYPFILLIGAFVVVDNSKECYLL